MFDIALFLYLVAVGFTVAGIVVSGTALVGDGAIRLGQHPANWGHAVGQVLLIVLGGPLLIARWVTHVWLAEGRPLPLAALCLTGAGFWSFCSGLVLMSILLAA